MITILSFYEIDHFEVDDEVIDGGKNIFHETHYQKDLAKRKRKKLLQKCELLEY